MALRSTPRPWSMAMFPPGLSQSEPSSGPSQSWLSSAIDLHGVTLTDAEGWGLGQNQGWEGFQAGNSLFPCGANYLFRDFFLQRLDGPGFGGGGPVSCCVTGLQYLTLGTSPLQEGQLPAQHPPAFLRPPPPAA